MTDTPTPGQVCYDAFMAALALDHPAPWHIQDPRHHAAWEAAAQAVLDAWQAQPRLEATP